MFLLLVMLFNSAQALEFREGKRGNDEDSGTVMSIEFFPYHVTLYDAHEKHPFNFRCGGTIIHPKIILTSATCTSRMIDFAVRAGSRSLCTGFLFESCEPGITLHRMNFVADTLYWKGNEPKTNNLALIKLQEALPMDATMKAALLPLAGALYSEHTIGNVTGHGRDPRLDRKGSTSILRWSRFEIANHNVCLSIYKGEYDASEMSCAHQINTFVCPADDGEPFVRRLSNGNFVVLGVSNYPQCPGEKEGYALFTKTYPFIHWIRTAIDEWLTPEDKEMYDPFH